MMKGSMVRRLERPVRKLPNQGLDVLNDLSIVALDKKSIKCSFQFYYVLFSVVFTISVHTYVGYGRSFGPMQLGESDNASPQRYLSPPSPSHFRGIFECAVFKT